MSDLEEPVKGHAINGVDLLYIKQRMFTVVNILNKGLNMSQEKKKLLEMVLTVLNDPDITLSERIAQAGGLLEKYQKPSTKFYKGQPVLVRGELDQRWVEAFYEERREVKGQPDKYLVKLGPGMNAQVWPVCKPDPNAVNVTNWIEHDGSMKVLEGDFILIEHTSGKATTHLLRRSIGNLVKRYAIISLPEFS